MMTSPVSHRLSPAEASTKPGGGRSTRARGRQRPHAWVAAVGIWAALGLASVASRPLPDALAASGSADRVVYHLVHILTLGALTGAVIWVARRTDGWRLWSRLALHVAMASVFAALVAAFGTMALDPGRSSVGDTFSLPTFELHFLAYFFVLAVAHAIDFVAWRRDQRVEEARLATHSARLEAQLARTELQILRSQLDPHFLFNALHVISELVHVDPERADRMVARLGDLLRMSASLARSADVPLRDELAFVNAYLEIQEARFGKRLRVIRQVDPATLDAAVPSLLVQPLVENAIRHGTSRCAAGGQLEIVTRRAGSSLVIEVLDNGPGLPADSPPDEGIGVGHTRARLDQMYGDESSLELEPRANGGTMARVRLPFSRIAQREGGRVAIDREVAL